MSVRTASSQDIEGRAEIEKLVNHFYTKVRADEQLAPIFANIAQVDWDEHLPKLYAFWQTVLFRDGGYSGNLLGAHASLLQKTGMDWPLFERWLRHFHESVDELFTGERAGHIKRCADDMTQVIHTRIHAPSA